jgi:hypothetical protein
MPVNIPLGADIAPAEQMGLTVFLAVLAYYNSNIKITKFTVF